MTCAAGKAAVAGCSPPASSMEHLPLMEVLYVRQPLCWSQVATAPAMLGTGSGERLRAPQGSTVSNEGNKKRQLLAFSKAL